jgi:RimJ/RimL family protein N-acetyltransferase
MRARCHLHDGRNYRGLGIASLILGHLLRTARSAGMSRFEAEVLAENQPMLAVFRRSCLPMHIKRDGRFNRTRLGTDCGLRVDAAVLRQHKWPPDREFGIL